jgi:chromosomal replication initiation ATPase DnaA
MIEANKTHRFDIKKHLGERSKDLFIHSKLENKKTNNPVLSGLKSWGIVSNQLHCLLGIEVHTQWFQQIVPLFINNNMLLLLTPDKKSCVWITRHYHKLIDLLLSFQDEKLSCFLVEAGQFPKGNLIKKSASKVQSYCEKPDCDQHTNNKNKNISLH